MRVFSQINNCQQKQNKKQNKKQKQKTDKTKRGAPLLGLAKSIYYPTNCHYAHIWSGSPQYLSSVHDRYPAVYVDDHIWKCTADHLFHGLFRRPFLKARQF